MARTKRDKGAQASKTNSLNASPRSRTLALGCQHQSRAGGALKHIGLLLEEVPESLQEPSPVLAAAALLSRLAEGVLVQAEGSNAEKAQSVGLPAPESCSVSCFMASGCEGALQAPPVPSDSLHPCGHGCTWCTAGGVRGSSSLWLEATNAWIWREKQTKKQKCKVFRIFSYTVRTKVGPQLQETWDAW